MCVAERENLAVSLGAAQHDAAGQLNTASALDAKLMGVLAFMSAVSGLLLTINKGLSSDRPVLFPHLRLRVDWSP